LKESYNSKRHCSVQEKTHFHSSSPPAQGEARDLRDAARTIGVQIRVFKVNNDSEIDAAFASFREQGIGAFLAATDASKPGHAHGPYCSERPNQILTSTCLTFGRLTH
jgi:hypothetical protein